MITVNKANPSQGEITSSLTGSTGDGAGLHLEAGGTITLTNAAAAEFGTSDFSLEFVLNRTANNTNNNVIYESHSSGNNRITLKALTGGDLVATFTNSSGINADYNTGYDIDVDLNTVTHYALTFDRSGDLTVYKNGNSVATISIAASSAVDIGASNTNTGRIGYVTTYGIIGTFYRFRAFNTLADAKLLFERADVPRTLTANLLFDLDLAFANENQSRMVADRSTNNVDGEMSSSGVKQTQVIKQLNSTAMRVGGTSATAATPADGEIIATGVKAETYRSARSDGDVYIQAATASDFVAIGTQVSSTLLKIDGSGQALFSGSKVTVNTDGTIDWGNAADAGRLTWDTNDAKIRGVAGKNLKLGANNQDYVTIDTSGQVQIQQSASDQSGASALKVTGTAYGTNKTIEAYMNTSSSTKSLIYAENSSGAVFNVSGDGLATFSNGINLGNSTLSNYEQGNFTLTDASGAGLTITGGLGRYTRIGNTVHVTVQFTMPTTSDSSAMQVSGLPYAVPNDNDYRGLVLTYSNKTGVEYALTQKNSDDINFYTDAGANATNADGSGGGFYINGHYKV